MFFFYFIRRHTTQEKSAMQCECSNPMTRSILYDNGYLYASNETGCQLSKIGSGYNNTMPGFIYARSNSCLKSGLFVEVGGAIIHRPTELDQQTEKFGFVLNASSLNADYEICVSPELNFARGEAKTVRLLKSNNKIIWFRLVSSDSKMLNILPQAYVSVIDFCYIDLEEKVVKSKRRIILTKSQETEESTIRMIQLLTVPKAHSADDQIKFPADSLSTSCGLRLTTLLESSITTCGKFITVLVSNPDCRSKSSKLIGTAYSFSTAKGWLQKQEDMTMEQNIVTPTLPKGFSINSSGIIYCSEEHKYWSVTYNRFDEFEGPPGHEPESYLKNKLSRNECQNEPNFLENILEHAAVLSMKSNVVLETQSISDLLFCIENALSEGQGRLCLLGLMILTHSNYDPQHISTDFNSVLSNFFDNFDCDGRLLKGVIDLWLSLCESKSLYQQFEPLLRKELKGKVKNYLNQLYIKRYLSMKHEKFNSDNKEWTLFKSIFVTEMQSNIEDIMELVESKKNHILGINDHLNVLIESICTIGFWSHEDHSWLQSFDELFQISISKCCDFLSQLSPRVESMHDKGLDTLLTSSLLSPTFVGVLVSLGSFCTINDKGFSEKSRELYLKICKFVSIQKEPIPSDLKIQNLLPWLFTKTVESLHPVKDGFKMQEVVKFPGAKCLLLVFDDKCSTLTDLDRFSIYSGSTMQSKKVLECCGNQRSIRRIGQKPWPKKPILVFGDTVTLDFEVKSRHELEPDMNISWGFQVSIGHCPGDLFEPLLIPSLESCLITLSPLVSECIKRSFICDSQTEEEKQCTQLLALKIIQRCHWSEQNVERQLQDYLENPMREVLPPLSLTPSKTIAILKSLSGFNLPIMRESTKKLLQPQLLEEGIVSAVIKHMSLETTVDSFLQERDPNTPDGCLLADIISNVYLKISSLIRRLQAIAEMEAKWNNEVLNFRDGLVGSKEFFFNDYLHHEARTRDLTILCFLKHIKQTDSTKALQSLKEKLEKESLDSENKFQDLLQTKQVLQGIFYRLELLLRVDVESKENDKTSQMSMSLQNFAQNKKLLKRQNSSDVEKSLDDSILQISRLQRSISRVKQSRSIVENSFSPLDLQGNPESIVEDLFLFIGSSPEESIPGPTLVKNILSRLVRCRVKRDAINWMRTLIKASVNIPIMQKLILRDFGQILMTGLHSNQLNCSLQISQKVVEDFSDCLEEIVHTISRNPTVHYVALAFLCCLPYEKNEEMALAKSGLLRELDKITDEQSVLLQGESPSKCIAEVSWMGFKLLAKRCVSWENNDITFANKKHNSLMERQISKILSNHLNQAVNCGHRSLTIEAVQETLNLLKDLVSSDIGHGILAQPTCITNLFSLLLDGELSPHITHTVIHLLQIALPIMNECDLQEIEVSYTLDVSKEHQIISLLMKKLSSLLMPSVSSGTNIFQGEFQEDASNDFELLNDCDDGSVQSLLLHKRPDQSGHELIQQLLNASSDIGIFSAMGSDSMEKVIKIDKDINEKNCAEVMKGDATRIFRAATKMAQLGFVVSMASPYHSHDHSSGWKHRAIQICLDRNNSVAKTSPTRPFISSCVANKLSTDILILIHRLLSSSNSDNWANSLQICLTESLASLPEYFTLVDDCNKNFLFDEKTYRMGQSLSAALAILGGFCETMKTGSNVRLVDNIETQYVDGVVKHIFKDQNCALIMVNARGGQVELKTCLNRIEIEDSLVETTLKFFGNIAIHQIPALQSVLIANKNGMEPLCLPLLLSSGDRNLDSLNRLSAEIRSKTCQVLSVHMKSETFTKKFLQNSNQSLDMLKYFAKESQPSDKLCCTEYICENIRGKFKDQTKPRTANKSLKNEDRDSLNHWNTHQTFPPLKSVVFTHTLTGVTYQGSPVTSIGLPKGVLLQAVHGLQSKASFFTIHILSLGEGTDESGAPTISIGLSPPNFQKEGAWNHPEGAILLHSNGRIVHYKGSNLLSWKSIRIDHMLSPGDDVTVKWTQVEEDNGYVTFEVNGHQIYEEIPDIPAQLLPTLHIQQKGVKTNATFSSFQGNPAIKTEDTVDTLHSGNSDQCNDVGGHRRQHFQPSRQAIKLKATTEFDTDSAYRLSVSGFPKFCTGSKQLQLQDEDWFDEDEDDEYDDVFEERVEDLNSLLVKSWEEKVFPSIRRRFRNESERRDGLEQIKGALSLGMIDIAKQTVEFLYEENGGVPGELKLPDIDDVKKDLLTLSIEKMRPGMIVNISEHDLQPLFACKEQLKTFGLEGEIIQTDIANELAEIETYLEEDGTVVQYWYPIDFLKKSSNERQVAKGRQTFSKAVQRDLLNCEFILSRLYCREAFTSVLEWINNHKFANDCLSMENSGVLGSTLTSNILLLQEWDVENILHFINKNGIRCHFSLKNVGNEINDPNGILHQSMPLITEKVFQKNKTTITDLLCNILVKTKESNHAHFLILTSEILSVFKEFEAVVPNEEILINDISMLSTTIHFPNCHCTIASMKFGKNTGQQHPETLKVSICPLEFSQKHKSLQHSANDLMKYPFNLNFGKHLSARRFTPALLSTNSMKICHSGAGDTNASLQIDGVTDRLLLGLSLIDLLVSKEFIFDQDKLMLEALDLLSTFLMKFELSPFVRTSLMYSISGLVQSLAERGVRFQSKTTDRVLEQISPELGNLIETETKGSRVNLHSIYAQSMMELCYQLNSLAPFIALELPKTLQNAINVMSILESMLKNHEPVSNVLKTVIWNETGNSVSKFIAMTGIPKALGEDEVCQTVKRSLSQLKGLGLVDVFFSIEEHSCLIQIQTGILVDDAVKIIQKAQAFHKTSHKDVHPETGTVNAFIVSKINEDLTTSDKSCQNIWLEFLKHKIFCAPMKFWPEVKKKIQEIFLGSMRDPSKNLMKFSDLLIKRGNKFLAFLNGTKNRSPNDIRDDLRTFFHASKVSNRKSISLCLH